MVLEVYSLRIDRTYTSVKWKYCTFSANVRTIGAFGGLTVEKKGKPMLIHLHEPSCPRPAGVAISRGGKDQVSFFTTL